MSDKIKVGDWLIYDLPIKYSETDYDGARKELIAKAERTPDLVALFEYGCVRAPGISDMDFWAVFDDNAKEMRVPGKPALSPKTRYLMMHKMIIISERHYRKMLYFDPWTTYAWPDGHRLLWQKEGIDRDLNFEKISFSPEERNILSAIYIEELLEAIYSNIPYYAKKKIPARSVFETLKDCVYIIEEINIVTDRKISTAFTDKFRDLRRQWFELDEQEAARQLIDMLHQGLLVAFEASLSLADWLGKNCEKISVQDLGIRRINCSALDKERKNVYISTFKDRRVFTDLIKNSEQALEWSINSYRRMKINLGWRTKIIDSFIVFQPLEMVSIPLALVNEKGFLTSRLKNDIFTNQNYLPIFNPQIFREKIKMINEITETYSKKERPNSDGKGFIFGNHRFGYLFGMKGIKRKIWNYWLRYRYWQTINKLAEGERKKYV